MAAYAPMMAAYLSKPLDEGDLMINLGTPDFPLRGILEIRSPNSFIERILYFKPFANSRVLKAKKRGLGGTRVSAYPKGSQVFLLQATDALLAELFADRDTDTSLSDYLRYNRLVK